MISFILNNDLIETNMPTGTVLLDFIRDRQNLKGTKEGCREGDCGACLILFGQLKKSVLEYKPINSCLLPLGDVHGCHIVTIEGIDTGNPNPLQQAFVDEGATQCGYCTPGFIMAEMAFLLCSKDFDPQKAIAAMDGNICRCTGYQSIKRAVEKISTELSENKGILRFAQNDRHRTSVSSVTSEFQNDRIKPLIQEGYLPDYFADMSDRLSKIKPVPILKEENIFVAGGTDLFVQKEPQISDKNLGLILNTSRLKGIEEKKGNIYLGASSTVTEISESKIIRKYFPKIESFLKLHSSAPIRNRATLGGNIVNASPIGDMTLFLLGLDATLVLDLNGQTREIAIKSFYKDYKKFDLKNDELIKSVYFKTPSKNGHFNFEKVSRRTYLDIASVTSAALVEVEDNLISDIHISAGGVAPYPFYLSETRSYLIGKTLSVENIKNAIKITMNEIAPISDMRGSAEYKSLLLGQLILAHFAVLFPTKLILTN
ncbi:MAG: (2Fe-2S)-binding protein [Calditrichaeota bacterium]|nr:MAG: (2Fe-2S)-binding protein [Calditrichota bacterium]MBL1205046.1 (2Fe-2S)-binding protein [Calditrichota bacterium]NOG44876.1 2Fe-2S iron-sulfur cluster binding domain-containing protein [Calditrichota bacterium]